MDTEQNQMMLTEAQSQRISETLDAGKKLSKEEWELLKTIDKNRAEMWLKYCD